MLAELKSDGFAMVGSLGEGQVAGITAYLAQRSVYNAHVVAKATEAPVRLSDALRERRWPAMCHPMGDAVLAPHLFELALQTYETAREYFGEPPRLYSMNAFWTQPAPEATPYLDTHGWHRDGDDRKQLVLFVLGTKTSEALGGVHRYQVGTHLTPDDSALGYDFRAPPPDRVRTIAGPAGTAFLSDTGGLHVGIRPTLGPRLLLWARWGVSERPASYDWDGLSPVSRDALGDRYPTDPELQDAIKLVVA